jgi:hypothetical protein
MPPDAVANFGKQVPMKAARTTCRANLATTYVMLADPLSRHISGAKRRGHRWQTDAVIKPEAGRLAENVSPLVALRQVLESGVARKCQD